MTGASVGHRALVRYYRQKLRPGRQLAVRQNSSAVSKVIMQYKALGWTGTTGMKFLLMKYCISELIADRLFCVWRNLFVFTAVLLNITC